MKLFLKYLWSEPLFRMLIPSFIVPIATLPWVLSWNLFLPYLFVPVVLIIFGGITFLLVLILSVAFLSSLEKITDGYKLWRKEQELPLTDGELELTKVTKVLERYTMEIKLKKRNSNAAQLYKEYQTVLALIDGVKVSEEIELDEYYWPRCLKRKQDI